jgi:WD40 repeat protein
LTVRIVDLQSSPPSEVATLRAPDDAPDTEPAKGFFAATFISDGRLATGDGKGRTWFWTVGKEPVRIGQPFGNDDAGPRSLFAATQAPVMVANNYSNRGDFQVWDLSTAEPKLRCRWSPSPTGMVGDAIFPTAMAISPDGRTLLTGHVNHAIRFWDIAGSEAVERLPLAPNPTTVQSGAREYSYGPFVLDDLLLTTTELRQPGLWQIEGDRLVNRPAPTDGDKPVGMVLGHSADGRFLAVTSLVNQDGAIFRRDRHRFELVRDFTKDNYASAALNRDGSRLVIGAGSTLELWTFEGARSRKVAEAMNRNQAVTLQIAFANDTLLITRSDGSAGPRVRLWDIQPAAITLRAELPEVNIWQFALSPDGHTLATGGNHVMRCWDLRTSPPQETPPFANRPDTYAEATGIRSIGAVAFSPDGRTLAANTFRTPLPDSKLPPNSPEFGYSIDLIDVATGETKRRLAYPGPVRNIQFTPDGRHLVTANGNSTIYVVRLAPP